MGYRYISSYNRYSGDIMDLKQQCIDYGFILSNGFRSASNSVIVKQWNGIGADGSWVNQFIPKSILGVDIRPASIPHDYEWSLISKSRWHFHMSNLHLFYNITVLLRKQLSKWLLPLAYIIAVNYYSAVESSIGYRNYLKGAKK